MRPLVCEVSLGEMLAFSLNVEGILAFAERVLPRAADLFRINDQFHTAVPRFARGRGVGNHRMVGAVTDDEHPVGGNRAPRGHVLIDGRRPRDFEHARDDYAILI